MCDTNFKITIVSVFTYSSITAKQYCSKILFFKQTFGMMIIKIIELKINISIICITLNKIMLK